MPSSATSRGSRSAPTAPAARPADSAPDGVDTRFLETLLGYNARRAALVAIGLFLQRLSPLGLRPVEFSVLTIIAHNPGITSRQLCTALDILPPNLVGLIKSLERRGLIDKRTRPNDRRAQGLYATADGRELQASAQKTVAALEAEVTAPLTTPECETLLRLLRKVYAPRGR